MAFEALAYGPEANVILVADGAELLAYDAQTEAPKWHVTFPEPLLSVFFAHPQALPASGGGSPWREAAATHVAIVLDAEGSFHAVDLSLGKQLGTVGPFGKPRAAASNVATGALAMAVDDNVLVWRNGQLVDTPLPRVSALAFSADGQTLAVGTAGGDVIMLSLHGANHSTSPAELQPAAPADSLVRTFEAHGVGPVADLVPHPSGTWLAAGANGVFAVTAKGTSCLEKLPSGALRARFDGAGARLAVQRTERAIVVYAWPALSVVARIEYTERPVRGLSFGPESWLGVGLDHGDGNKIDVVTSATHRTDTAPGRTHRSWTLYVEGQRNLLSANEAEEIRRMKSPFHEEAPQTKRGAGGKIGIGAVLSFVVLGLRVCAHSSGSSYSPSSAMYPMPALSRTCDAACAKSRVADLETDCNANSALGCADDAAAAKSALAAGRCENALAAVKRMESAEARGGASSQAPLFAGHRILAELGLGEACRSGAIRPPAPIKHAQLVRIGKNASKRVDEVIPEDHAEQGETPRALFAAPDGTVFAATLTQAPQKCVVYERSAAGEWKSSFTTSSPTGDVALFGRGASDVYLAAGTTLAHFDGSSWNALPLPSSEIIDGAALAGADVLVASGASHEASAVHRRLARSGAWTNESLPQGISVLALYGAGAAVWAVGEDEDAHNVLLRRAPTGAWSAKIPKSDGSTTLIVRSGWASPSGDAFVGTSSSVLRSKDGGATWTEDQRPDAVVSLWGRTSSDVYALEGERLAHFDGKRWSSITDDDLEGAQSMAGTATEVLILRAAAP